LSVNRITQIPLIKSLLEQETQLSLTNRATRLEVNQRQQKGPYHAIC